MAQNKLKPCLFKIELLGIEYTCIFNKSPDTLTQLHTFTFVDGYGSTITIHTYPLQPTYMKIFEAWEQEG